MKRNTSLTQLFRNGISMLCGILLLSASLSSCLDEPLFETPGRSDQGVKMYIRIPAPSISQTRAGSAIDDKYVDPSSVYVFMLSGTQDDSNVLQIVNAVAGTGDTYYAKLKESSTARYVYVVANAKDIIEKIGIEALSKMTLSQLKLQLSKTVKAESGVISEPISLQPMFGEWELPSGITPETTIGTSVNPVLLVRATSKITIANKTTNGNFKLSGANLVNAPKLGYIVSGQAATGDRYPTGADGDINKMISTPTAGNETETVLYSFESAVKGEGQSTFVIIEAEYLNEKSYYRLNLSNKEGEYPLLRNNHYMVTINNVNKKGYGSVTEAMKNPAANIDYVVNVIDETGRNMVSNGEYYLAVSQTEFYYFSEEKGVFEKQEVAIVTHNAPKSVLSGTCEVSDPNISIEDGGGFSKNTGGLQTFPLKVTMKNGITEGTITLKLGDLKREIKVYHREVNETFHFGAFFKNFAKEGNYIAGKVDKEYESWIRLTNIEQDSDEDNQHSSIEQPDGKIFVRVKANLGSTTSPKYRTGQLDLFRKDSEGNARIVFHQKMYDIYKDIVDQAKISPYTYVGTFHRWNETGERLIRIHADNISKGAGNSFRWKAFIVTGDFIRLSDKPSKDTGINFNSPYGKGDNTLWSTTEKVESNGQLEEDAKTELTVEGPISFRVGLTSKLAGPSSKPRYGLIAVIANWDSNPVTRYIYVRQGEEADYLMRPEDAMVKPAATEFDTRPLVEKFSPYNLTDLSNHDTSLPQEGHSTDFVKFPSQAGYMYEAVYYVKEHRDGNLQWIPQILEKGRGWRADGLKYGNYSEPYDNPWDIKYEICPNGYRRPKGHANNTEEGLSGGVMNSPVRQSLWLYPKDGMISQTQNFIIGYLADGYYDRRAMSGMMGENLPSIDGVPQKNNQPTYVSNGATIAYIGALAFNPYNSASLFIPFSGTRQSGVHSGYGQNGYFWTSNRNEKKRFWTVAAGLLTDPGNGSDPILKFRADNYGTDSNQAISVRCVKE